MAKRLQNFIMLGLLIFGFILISGCVAEKTQTNSETSNTDKSSQIYESRIKALEQKVDELEKINNYNGLMKQSTKNLIPTPPFTIIVHFNKDWTYLFKENGELEIRKGDPIPYKASYILYSNNNTIKISPPKAESSIKFDEFDPYWLRLFDYYASVTYENGWIDWVEKYDIKTK